MVYFVWFINGLLAWAATGVDDILMVYTLGQNRSRASQFLIVVGTSLGTCLMFLLAQVLAWTAVSIAGASQYLQLLGLVPFLLGWRLVSKNIGITVTKEETIDYDSGRNALVLAMMVYLANSTDDLSVNCALLANTSSELQNVCLLLGNICGSAICALLAILFSNLVANKTKRAINLLAGFVLMAIGLSIMLGLWK